MSDQPAISACVITLNEADRIEACLRSLAWCDEVVVVDSHSTDDTRERAAALGARVIERDWPGFAAQKEFAVRAAAHDWVLCVDADERVSERLARRDRDAARAAPSATRPASRCRAAASTSAAGSATAPGIPIARCGSSIAAAAASSRTRPTICTSASCSTAPTAPWRTISCTSRIASISEHLQTIDRYTTIMAEGLHARGRRAGVQRPRPASRLRASSSSTCSRPASSTAGAACCSPTSRRTTSGSVRQAARRSQRAAGDGRPTGACTVPLPPLRHRLDLQQSARARPGACRVGAPDAPAAARC